MYIKLILEVELPGAQAVYLEAIVGPFANAQDRVVFAQDAICSNRHLPTSLQVDFVQGVSQRDVKCLVPFAPDTPLADVTQRMLDAYVDMLRARNSIQHETRSTERLHVYVRDEDFYTHQHCRSSVR